MAEHYADHPGADRIYSLALRRQPAGAPPPPRPLRGYLGGNGQEGSELVRVDYHTELDRSPAEDAAVRDWRNRIDQLVGAGQPDKAERSCSAPRSWS